MKACTLMSGSSGNAIYVETKEAKVLIDAGQTGKRITQALEEVCSVSPKELDAIIITHAHRDHISGAGVLSRRFSLPIYATEGTWHEMKPLIGAIETENIRFIDKRNKWELKDLQIESFPTSHDAMESVGFVCSNGKVNLGIATDSGVFTVKMSTKLKNMDCLILESNHDTQMLNNGPYPWSTKKRIASIMGHLSNEGAGLALLKTLGENTKNVILAHLSEENNKPSLALETVRSTLEENQLCIKDTDISVAPRYKPGNCVSL
ncbi:MAG: MBL fold metallo-hydrolase [Firmicutes bacterium HGW-Firmicutes-12]|jgi:phosphoribosyl 1,2-cyclic phosphodiesterase|nr:MAG: MBL fold metallo-hydrolase [Firmicutes bacterium HGW-Firmicutes-12]